MANIPPDGEDAFGAQVTRGEALRSIWQWRKYRNQAFWGVFYRFGILVIGLTFVPYLFHGLIQRLGWVILVFPCTACMFSIFAAYLIAVNYKLYKQVDKRYWHILGRYKPEDIPNTKLINRLSRIYFGKVFSLAFFFFGIVIQLVNSILLYNLAVGNLP